MLRHRLPVSLALIALFVLILLADGLTAPYHVIWMVMVVAAGAVAAFEIAPLLAKSIGEPLPGAMAASVALCLSSNVWASISRLQGIESLGPLGLAWILSVCGILAVGVRRFDDTNPISPRIAATLFAVAYLGVLGSFLALLRFRNGPDQGLFALALVVATTKGTDIGAYTFGKLFGRHLMTPKLSPKKTWEGAAGGLIFAIAFVMAITETELAVTGRSTLETWAARVVFALIVSAAGQIGDLAESMIKREADVKDASAVIPGFGGVLDLIDSLLYSAPVGWMVLTILGCP